MPIEHAIEALVWRARIASEDPNPNNLKRLVDAIDDYFASRPSSRQGLLDMQPNGHAPAQMELRP
jgi:hypothetical protein